ncbi:MAG: rhodanese-like domain-containing protein [Terrisporobacter sp.]|uniref:rhodanese-like domain-containing protein n=1 Tax=Terrisporobacter sp. TaxID=1965305 RepID=UPI002FC814B3
MIDYKEISSLQLNDLILKKKKFLLLDVRTEEEYSAGHIPNSINIPLHDLDSQIDHLAPYKDEKVIIYCRSGKRSLAAALLLQESGFKYLYNLTQGIIGHLDYL